MTPSSGKQLPPSVPSSNSLVSVTQTFERLFELTQQLLNGLQAQLHVTGSLWNFRDTRTL